MNSFWSKTLSPALLRRVAATLMIGLVLATGSTGMASAQGSWGLGSYTLEAGGGSSSGQRYTVSGTAGQTDAGIKTGAIFSVLGGFWVPTEDRQPTDFDPSDQPSLELPKNTVFLPILQN